MVGEFILGTTKMEMMKLISMIFNMGLLGIDRYWRCSSATEFEQDSLKKVHLSNWHTS